MATTMDILTSSPAAIIDTPSSGAGLRGQQLTNTALDQGGNALIDAADQYNIYEAENAEDQALLEMANNTTTRHNKIVSTTSSSSSTGSVATLKYSNRMTQLANRSSPAVRAQINNMAKNRMKLNPQFSAAIAEQNAKDKFRADAIVAGIKLGLEDGLGTVDNDKAVSLYIEDLEADAAVADTLEKAQLLEANTTLNEGRQLAKTSTILAKSDLKRHYLVKEIRSALSYSSADLGKAKDYLTSKGIDSTNIKNIEEYRLAIRSIFIQQLDRFQDDVRREVIANPGLRNYKQANEQFSTFEKQGENLKKQISNEETWKLMTNTQTGLLSQAKVGLYSNPPTAHVVAVLETPFANLPGLESMINTEEFKKGAADLLRLTGLNGMIPTSNTLTDKASKKMSDAYYKAIGPAVGKDSPLSKEHKERVMEDVKRVNKKEAYLPEGESEHEAETLLNISQADVTGDADAIENQNKTLRKLADNTILPAMEKLYKEKFSTNTGMAANFLKHFTIIKGPTKDQEFSVESVVNINVHEDGTPVFSIGKLTEDQETNRSELEDYVKALNSKGKLLKHAISAIARNNNVSTAEAMASFLGDRFNLGNKPAEKDKVPVKKEKPYIIFKP